MILLLDMPGINTYVINKVLDYSGIWRPLQQETDPKKSKFDLIHQRQQHQHFGDKIDFELFVWFHNRKIKRIYEVSILRKLLNFPQLTSHFLMQVFPFYDASIICNVLMTTHFRSDKQLNVVLDCMKRSDPNKFTLNFSDINTFISTINLTSKFLFSFLSGWILNGLI